MPVPTEFSGVFFGDYTGLDAFTDAHPIWADTRNLDLFLCPGTGTPGHPPANCTGTESGGTSGAGRSPYTSEVLQAVHEGHSDEGEPLHLHAIAHQCHADSHPRQRDTEPRRECHAEHNGTRHRVHGKNERPRVDAGDLRMLPGYSRIRDSVLVRSPQPRVEAGVIAVMHAHGIPGESQPSTCALESGKILSL